MATSYKGWQKYAIILLFLGPTVFSVFFVNIYPIGYNVYASFTNRNTFRPRANCIGEEVQGETPSAIQTTLVNMFDAVCWDVFAENAVTGRGQFYSLSDPASENYSRLLGDLVTPASLRALGMVLLGLSPLAAVYAVRQQLGKQLSPPRTWWLWPLALVVVYLLWRVLDLGTALTTLQESGDFFIVIFRTVIYVLACIPLFFLVGLTLALILNNQHIKGVGIWRAVLIIPWAIQSYIAALVWQFFFRGEVGTINQIGRALGLFDGQGPTWLGDPERPWLAMVAVVIINLWMSYPFFTVVILGALQSIPQDQYEAADVDGATWWDKLSLITLPLLRPAVLPAVVLSSITTFQMFNTVYLVTAGGPVRGAGQPGFTEFVMIHAYRLFQDQNFGRMGAFAVIIFALLFAATMFSLRLTRITKGAYE